MKDHEKSGELGSLEEWVSQLYQKIGDLDERVAILEKGLHATAEAFKVMNNVFKEIALVLTEMSETPSQR